MPRTLKRVKEQLRAIPRNGLGYGLLRYLHPAIGSQLARHPEPQIGFNYLGRFSAGETLSVDIDPAMPLFHLLDINAQTEDGPDGPRLSATWTWAGERIQEATVRDRKSTRLNSSHLVISYAVFCLKKKMN